MSRQSVPRREPAGKWSRRKGWLLAASTIGLAIWGGCTVTPQNYKTLSFFFDGVPDPTLAARGEVVGADGVVRAAQVWVHKPFAEENCVACHKSRYRPSKNDGSICLPCHEAVPAQHERMHGPVTVGACNWCHSAHESRYPHLLRDTDRKVCAQCHAPNLLDASKVPEHAEESRGCLECHLGHGGGVGRFMLRQDAAPGRSPGPPVPAEK